MSFFEEIQREPFMSYSLNSLNGVIQGIISGTITGGFKGDARSLAYSYHKIPIIWVPGPTSIGMGSSGGLRKGRALNPEP